MTETEWEVDGQPVKSPENLVYDGRAYVQPEPVNCPDGHRLGPGRTLVGTQACQATPRGTHLMWTCREPECGAVTWWPPVGLACDHHVFDGRGSRAAVSVVGRSVPPMSSLSRWQGPDGWPTDDYFRAVEAAVADLGVPAYGERDEPWDYALTIDDEFTGDGPLSWALGGVQVVWLVGEDDEPADPEDFTRLGWYWIGHKSTGGGDGNPVQLSHTPNGPRMPFLEEPEDVAEAIHRVATTGE